MTVLFSLPTHVSTRFKLALSVLSHTRGTKERKLYRSRQIAARVDIRRRVRAVAAREENQHGHT